MNNEEELDLKELNREKGLIQKLADAENKIDNDDRKQQMAVAIEVTKLIKEKVKESYNEKKEEPKNEVTQAFNSSELAEEIKREINSER